TLSYVSMWPIHKTIIISHLISHIHNPLNDTITNPTPPSTLFPYTTLFRSPQPVPPPGVRSLLPAATRGTRRPDRRNRRADRVRGDRKSTRLNSSHVKISYAVFCLKKKKNSIIGAT